MYFYTMISIFRLIIIIVCTSLMACKSSTTDYAEGFDELWQQMPYKTYTDSIRLFPKNDALYFARGELLFTHQQLRASLYDYKQAYRLKPSYIYLQAITVNFTQLQQLDSAIVYLQRGVEQFPNDSIFYFQLIDAYTANHKDSLALQLLKPLLDSNVDNAFYIEKAGKIYVALKDTMQAIALLEQHYRINKKVNDATLQLAYLYAETNNIKALQLSDAIIMKDSMHYKASPYYIKGIYFTNINKLAAAIEMFDESIAHDWTFVEAYTDKGVILFKQKKYKEAKKVFELSLKASNTYPDAYYWVGQCEEALGKKKEAEINYRKAISLDKNFEEAKKALKRVDFALHLTQE